MTAFPSYAVGTVSIGAGGTVIEGAGGPLWTSTTNARPGDDIIVAGHIVIVEDVIDDAHIAIDAWPFAAVPAGTPYKIVQRSPLRFAGAEASADVIKLVAALNTEGLPIILPPGVVAPDPSIGEENQFALQPSSFEIFLKSGGAWVFQGIYKGFRLRGEWAALTNYAVGDAVSRVGASYVAINPNTSAPPESNASDWQLLAAKGDPGAKGDKGDPGSDGAGYLATSTTSLAIAVGAHTFATQSGLAYTPGARVRASNGGNYMEGGLTAYDGASVTINVDRIAGAGSFANWNINLAGEPGGGGDLQSTNNLSELTDKGAARANLGALSSFAAMYTAKAYGAPIQTPKAVAFGFVSSGELNAGASTSATLDITNGRINPTSSTDTQVSQSAGAIIGQYTGGGAGQAAAFDGVTSQNDVASAVSGTATTQFLGKNFTGSPKVISRAIFFPSNQSGYCANSTGGNVTLNLRGKQTAPSSSSDGALLATASVAKSSTAATTLISTDQATAWNFVWVESAISSAGNFTVAEMQFFSPGTLQNMEAVLPPMTLPSAATKAHVLVEYSQQIAAIGAPIGTMTSNGGLASLFDGIISINDAGAAVNGTAATTAYAGINLSSAAAIAAVVLFPDNQSGLAGTAALVTLNLRAKHTAPASSSDGTLLASVTLGSSQTDAVTLVSNDGATAWEYVWVEFTASSAVTFCGAELQLFTAPTINSDLTASVSLDNMAHYTQVALEVVGRGRRGRFLAEATFSAVANSGNTAVLKFNTANSKNIALHGALLEVA